MAILVTITLSAKNGVIVYNKILMKWTKNSNKYIPYANLEQHKL